MTSDGTAEAEWSYDAFISYRRQDGTGLARRLREQILTYRLPRGMRARQRELRVFLDTVYERATDDFFENTIVPALEKSHYLIVVRTPSTLARAPDGSPSWMEREIVHFRRTLPQGENVIVVLDRDDLKGPVPSPLNEELPRLNRVSGRWLTPLHRLWPPRRSRATSDLLPLLAVLHDIEPAKMPELRQEEQRRALRGLVALLGASVTFIGFIAVALTAAVINQVAARQASWRLQQQLLDTERTLADTLAIRAEQERLDGHELAALRLLVEATSTAPTPSVRAYSLAARKPMLVHAGRIGPETARPALFHPDGQTLLLGHLDGTLSGHDFATREELWRVDLGSLPIVDLDLSGDGSTLVAVLLQPADGPWNARLDPQARSEVVIATLGPVGMTDLRRLPSIAPSELFFAVAVDHVGRFAVVGTATGARWFDVSNVQFVHTFEQLAPTRPGYCNFDASAARVALSPNGELVAASSISGHVRVWSATSGRQLSQHQLACPSMFAYNDFRPAFSEDGTSLYFGSFDGTIHHWQYPFQEAPRQVGPIHDGAVNVAIPTNWGVVSGSYDGSTCLSEPTTGHRLACLPTSSGSLHAGLSGLAVSSDPLRVATIEATPAAASAGGTWLYGDVHLWHEPPNDPTTDLGVEAKSLAGVDLSPEGLVIAWWVDDRLRLKAGDFTSVALEGSPFTRLHTALREGRALHTLQIDTSTRDDGMGRFRRVPDAEDGSRIFFEGRVSPSGGHLFLLSGELAPGGHAVVNPELLEIDVNTGSIIDRWPIPLEAVTSLGPMDIASRNETVTFAVGEPATVLGVLPTTHVFTLERDGNHLEQQFTLQREEVTSLSILPDGKGFLLGTAAGEVWVKNATGEWNLRLDFCCNPVFVDVAPDGRRFAAAARSEVHVYTLVSGQPERLSTAPVGVGFSPTVLRISPDGRLVLAGTEDGTVRFWSLPEMTAINLIELGTGPIYDVLIGPAGDRLVTISDTGLQTFGAWVPPMRMAEAVTRHGVIDGRLTTADEGGVMNDEYPASPDAAAIELWHLLAASEVHWSLPSGLLEWLFYPPRLAMSQDLADWIEANEGHALAQQHMHFATIPVTDSESVP